MTDLNSKVNIVLSFESFMLIKLFFQSYIRDVKDDLIPKLLKEVGELDSQI